MQHIIISQHDDDNGILDVEAEEDDGNNDVVDDGDDDYFVTLNVELADDADKEKRSKSQTRTNDMVPSTRLLSGR